MPAIRKSSPNSLRSLFIALATAFVLQLSPLANQAIAQDFEPDELFAFPPQTPVRLIRAAILANQLDRPLLARKYLTSFLDIQPGQTTLRALRKEIGISVFLKLSSTEQLKPESTSVLKLINEANPYPQLSPSNIQDLIESLGQSPDDTTTASLQLISAAGDAAVPLLAADPQSPSGVVADQLLSRYARRFQTGLLAALPNSESGQQVRILNYLGKTANQELSIQILPLQYSAHPAVASATANALQQLKATSWVGLSKPEAANVLVEQSAAALKAASKHQATVILTNVSETANADPNADSVSKEASSTQDLEVALTLATQAVALAPSQKSQAAKYAAEAAANAWPAQWQDPSLDSATEELSTSTKEIMTAAIMAGLQANSTAGLLRMLNDLNHTAQIFESAPIVKRKCLTNADPRVRLLAAAAAFQKGDRSDRVMAAITPVVDGARQPEAVVIDPRVGDGSVAAGILRGIGYSVDFERAGRNGFSTATEQLHCELIMVHSNCLQWPLSTTIANLRTDYRTANVPIVIYGPAQHQSNVASKVNRDPQIWFEAEPLTDRLTPESLRLQKVLAPLLSKQQRIEMIKFALRLTDAR